MSGERLHFAYAGAVAPMMWAFVAIAGIELVVLHLLLSLWNPWVAMTISILTLAGILWLVRAILSFARLPIVLDGEALVMRVGTIKRVTIPIALIEGLGDVASTDRRAMLNLALITYPNIVVRLRTPLAGRRGISTVAHRLDDPAAFARALESILAPA